MRLLVLGGDGLLGSNVVVATNQKCEVTATYRSGSVPADVSAHELDIRDTARFKDLLERVDPTAVVNCAAMTDVDACESKPDQARAVNATAPSKIADVCNTRSVQFCHISTDYVFDGEERTPYDESAEPNPIQVYGESKLAGDRAVRDAHASSLIIRPSFVYGIDRSTGTLTGFPAWVRDRLRADEPVSLFDDQYITPSRAGQVASVLLQLLQEGADGTFNVACRTCTTPYEIGDWLRERLNYPKRHLESGSQEDFDRPADRPRYTCLDVSKVESRLDSVQPTLETDLSALEPVLRAE